MVRWRSNGGYPVAQLRDEVDRLVGDFLGNVHGVSQAWGAARGFPAVNLWEEGDALFAEAELPGVKTEDIDVSVVGSELTIRGRRPESAGESTSFHRRERGTGEFSRTLRLPFEVDPAAVEATLRDGVLLVKLPKAASARPRKIQVGTGK
jgi:HSP20 family protein